MITIKAICRTTTQYSKLAASRYLKRHSNNCLAQPSSKISQLPVRLYHLRASAISSFLFASKLRQDFCTTTPDKTNLMLIKQACQQLLQLDSLILDKMCVIFGSNYILRDRFLHEKDYKVNQQLVIAEFSKAKQQSKWTLPFSEETIFGHIRLIFQFLNASKVGFLRGDLHVLTFNELQKNLESRLEGNSVQSREQSFSQQDFKALFNKITNINEFRLPFKGIYKRQHESKVNLYQRQLVLEEVTSEQSHLQFEEVLESLMRLNKIQEVQVVRRFMTDWISPVTLALQEEQNRCLRKELNPNRKVYGPYLVKLNPEKIATATLAQLIISIFQQIYKQGSIDMFDLQLFNGVEEKKFLSKILSSIESELAFEKEEKAFKQCQREYDSFIRQENDKKSKMAKESENVKVNDNENMDMNASENTDLNESVGKEAKEEKGKNKFWKSEEFKEKQKNQRYKFVPYSKRKDFIENLRARMSRFLPPGSSLPENVKNRLGHLIIYILKEVLTIENKYGYKVPLLSSEHRSTKKKDQFSKVAILRINEHFLRTVIPKLEKTEDIFIHMERSLPTIIEPLPWLDPEIGGYYSQATTVMKYSNCPVQERAIKYADNHRIFEVLNFLSSTPWKINQSVLAIVEQIWTEGGQQNYIPKRYSQMLNTYRNNLLFEKDHQRRKELNKQIQEIRDQFSLRGDFNLKLNIARYFGKLDHFYFPHNLDFRGRVYPIPPHLNHIGNDLVRGLLTFAKGIKLGPDGFRWLKIHTANLMGKDKAPINEKLIFIQENLQKIHQIAAEPLKYREWLKFEDSWQAIASIIELSEALRSECPEEYVSHLHVHQDGSCNGLQHYAALGRDTQGAYQVNLGPGSKPSDIYTHVSKMVIKMIEEDLKGEPADHHVIARKLIPNIKRKTLKQTVMTSVYGVTFIGARQQIYKQLRDQNFMSEDQNYAASIYLAKLTLLAISNLFTGAHNIKQWFRKCASLVSKTGNPVGWVTPLGLPVVEPYRRQARLDTISTLTHSMSISRAIQNIPIDSAKQASAFPPNYVHSLDSSHMMYTAEVCKRQGITFAAVHDSYWTHAASVEKMNKILREQFIRLHSQPLLERFKTGLESQFPQIQFPPIPNRGDFDLEEIKQSQYFFS